MVILCPRQGVFHPCPGNPVHPKARLALLNLFILFFLLRSTSTATHSLHTLHLARDVMAAARASRTSSLVDGTIRQGFTLLPDSDHTCSHDVSLRIPKANLAFRGAPHASTCAFGMRRVTSWLHVWSVSGRRVNPCRMVPSTRDEVCEACAAA